MALQRPVPEVNRDWTVPSPVRPRPEPASEPAPVPEPPAAPAPDLAAPLPDPAPPVPEPPAPEPPAPEPPALDPVPDPVPEPASDPSPPAPDPAPAPEPPAPTPPTPEPAPEPVPPAPAEEERGPQSLTEQVGFLIGHYGERLRGLFKRKKPAPEPAAPTPPVPAPAPDPAAPLPDPAPTPEDTDTLAEGKAHILGNHTELGMHTYRVEYKLPSGDRVVGGSDLGVNYKDENEDRVVLERSRVTVVDGMGGQSSGQEAATLIADAVASGMPFHEAMHQAIKAIQTDQNIRNDAGAAVVSAEIKKDPSGQKILDIHSCGDCSLFVLDATGTVVFEAEQDSLVLNLVKQGIITKEEALIHPDKNVVTNAVDGTATPDKSFRKESFPLQPGYRIFIMSDGIGDNLIPEEIARLTHGQALAEAFKTVEDVVTQRMQANGTLTYNAAQKKYSDGYVQPAKKDNRSLIVIDVA